MSNNQSAALAAHHWRTSWRSTLGRKPVEKCELFHTRHPACGRKLALVENAQAIGMSNREDEEICYFCKKGHFIRQTEEIAFHQWTDKGYVFCRISAVLGVCDHCDSRDWSEETEALIDEAVRREYGKLP